MPSLLRGHRTATRGINSVLWIVSSADCQALCYKIAQYYSNGRLSAVPFLATASILPFCAAAVFLLRDEFNNNEHMTFTLLQRTDYIKYGLVAISYRVLLFVLLERFHFGATTLAAFTLPQCFIAMLLKKRRHPFFILSTFLLFGGFVLYCLGDMGLTITGIKYQHGFSTLISHNMVEPAI